MQQGTLVVRLDDALCTALARFGLRKAQLPVPLPFSVDNLQVKNLPGTQIEVTAGVFKAVLRPRIDASGQVDMAVQFVGVKMPAFVTDRIKEQINKQIENARATSASQGIQFQLTSVDTEAGALLASATAGA